MSLKIKTELQNESGFKTADAYARVAVVDNINGDELQVVVNFFTNKESFDNGLIPFSPKDIELGLQVAYDRATMSTDILDVAHDAYITYLADKGVTAEKSL